MDRRFGFACLLALLLLPSACDRPPKLTPTFTPTIAPYPAPTPLPCPDGYKLYADNEMGFSACFPLDWVLSKKRDPENRLTRVSFNAPAGTTGAGLRFISVSVSPAVPASSEEQVLQEMNNWLLQEYYQALLTRPRFILVDGRRSVDAGYEATVVLGREAVKVTRWVTILLAEDQQWFVDVAGRSEYRDELEQLRSQFLSSFHLLPVMTQH